MTVIDGSAAVKGSVTEPGTAEAAMLLLSDEERAAPEHLVVEVGRAFLRHHWTGAITSDHCRVAVQQISRLVRLFPTAALVTDALDTAGRAGCSVYDALCVAAAERWDARVVTADARLVAPLAGRGWHGRAHLLAA